MTDIYDQAHMVGGMTMDYWDRDPKRLAFVLARYKHVGRMLQGCKDVLEVGCADGFGSRIVRQHVRQLTAVDVDAKSIEEAQARQSPHWPVQYMVHDFLRAPLISYDAVYALDVLEHIAPDHEYRFLQHLRIAAPVCIIGMPSAESQAYASPLSKAGHVNCQTELELFGALKGFYRHVFMFGMNDEVLHTGFGPMCHYRLALCVDDDQARPLP